MAGCEEFIVATYECIHWRSLLFFGDFGGKGVSIGMIHNPEKRLNYGLKSSDLPSSR